MSKKSRTKGKVGERECLNELGEWLGRRLSRNHAQTDQGGSDAVDLPCSLEIKRSERFLTKYLDQAQEQAAAERKPAALAWRPSRKPWLFMVLMSPAEFADYIREKEEDCDGR